MKFSIILDSIQSTIVPSDSKEGYTWTQAIQAIESYCRDSGYDLQSEYFAVVSNHQEEYLSGTFPLILV
nr:MAG: hypothetical protein [Caudoviricetes sp.]